MLPMTEPTTDVVLEAPAGLIRGAPALLTSSLRV
jgi:hypothetical protein